MINMASYKAGVLGVVVVMIAIIATLMGSWVMSLDVDEVSVTKYSPLTEITSQFDTEQTPLFTEYNPSTNYTGYYTDYSVIGDTKYFSGVSYVKSYQPNNFKLTLPPDTVDNGNLDLSEISDTESYNLVIADYNGTEKLRSTVQGQAFTLADFISAFAIGNDVNFLEIRSIDNLSDYDSSQTGVVSMDWAVFGSVDDIEDGSITMRTDTINSDNSQYYNAQLVSLSIEYDRTTQICNLYSNNDCTGFVRTLSADKVIVFFGGVEPPSSVADVVIKLGTTAYTVQQYIPGAEYMDPSKGVALR